jgi:hypothetical protein
MCVFVNCAKTISTLLLRYFIWRMMIAAPRPVLLLLIAAAVVLHPLT